MGGIHSAAYRRDREQARLGWRRRRRPCHLCGGVIDYDAPATDPQHFQLDHIKSRKKFPELEHDPTNWAPAHARCNKHKQEGDAAPGIGLTSEPW
jgi:5-methylcytosine-specific restriction endonuclease McrA